MTVQITADNVNPTTLTQLGGPVFPKITSIVFPGESNIVALLGGQTVTIFGSNFVSGTIVYIDNYPAISTTVVSSTELNFVTIASPTFTNGVFSLTVSNPSGTNTEYFPGIEYSSTPVWKKQAGSLGNVYESNIINITTGAFSDNSNTYSLVSGNLPPGCILNSSTGDITGQAELLSISTTYTFTLRATDTVTLFTTDRIFSITILPDVITFTNPSTNPVAYLRQTQTSFSLILSASSASGNTVSYTVNNLPSGISLTSDIISGTFNTVQTLQSSITATSAVTNKVTQLIINFEVILYTTGQQAFTTPGTYSWSPPIGVYSVSVVAIGGGGGGRQSGSGGGGGGGGGLGWKNNISVTSDQSYTVVVGTGGTINTSGTPSYFIDTSTVAGLNGSKTGGSGGGAGGSYVGEGGGAGGNGGTGVTNSGGGGGGAGGYSGNGGNGGDRDISQTGFNGSGGGGGGAGYGGNGSGGGGGVGIFGQGSNGVGSVTASYSDGGGGGSSGASGTIGGNATGQGSGGSYGGGGGSIDSGTAVTSGTGGGGAVRIIWGPNRAFPSSNTEDM